MKRPRSIVVVAFLAFALVPMAGCQDAPKKRPPSSAPPSPAPLPKGTYPDGPEGLQRLWHDILDACRKGQMDRVQRLFASLTMTQPELAGLLGSERANALWPSYQRMMSLMVQAGAEQLKQRLATEKFDEVIPLRVDEQPDNERSPTEQRLLKALVRKVPLYSVRIKRDDLTTGVRYESFVYLDGSWRTGGQIAAQFPPEPPLPAAPPSQ